MAAKLAHSGWHTKASARSNSKNYAQPPAEVTQRRRSLAPPTPPLLLLRVLLLGRRRWLGRQGWSILIATRRLRGRRRGLLLLPPLVARLLPPAGLPPCSVQAREAECVGSWRGRHKGLGAERVARTQHAMCGHAACAKDHQTQHQRAGALALAEAAAAYPRRRMAPLRSRRPAPGPPGSKAAGRRCHTRPPPGMPAPW